ncbi:uncharacterized protein ACRADG_002740 [Cochliomyia hominivorax]
MGGCRCYFRDCHVNNVRFPRMHFFRFPLKDTERYKKWRQYAKMEQILEFSEVRRKNTNICARHFRTECFMNYKMQRLVPSAVPTLMRLSKDKALDFEMDNEKGVLVTLEKTKYPHLIPPENFESPLQLETDKILMEKLNQLQNQQYHTDINIAEDIQYTVTDSAIDYDEILVEKPGKIEILEAIQVTAPNIKRHREMDKEPCGEVSGNNKKCRILNAAHYTGGQELKNGATIVLAAKPHQSDHCEIINYDDIDIIESEQTENSQELVNHDGDHLLLSTDNFITNDAQDDENIEFVEIHKDELNYELPSNDTDTTVIQLKSTLQDDSHTISSATYKQRIELLEKELTDLRLKYQDFNILQVKLSILESENAELKEIKKDKEDLNKKVLALHIENNNIKKSLKDNKTLNEKLRECTEENEKLKQEVAIKDILKAELTSRQEETKELKRLLEALKCSQSKEQEQRKLFELQLEEEKYNFSAKEQTLKDELSTAQRKLELMQQQLKSREVEIKELKLELHNSKNEKQCLAERHEELQQSLHNIQNNFDVKQNDYKTLKADYDNQQQKYTILEQKYWKLQALQNQESIVSTSKNVPTPVVVSAPTPVTANSLTKAQLFNGIKRYLSASMVSLLRMEMFGSSEREWKNDERQVAVDVLRLGENVYKYFTDEWRFRLPALRDVRSWLSQSEQMVDDEEDL